MKTSFALFVVATLTACATSSNQSTEPAPAPAPSVSSSSATAAPATRSGPSGSVATSRGGNVMPQARSVYYEYDKSEIKPEGAKTVDAHAQYLRQHPEIKVKVEGNADERGSAEYNLALG